MIVRMKKTYLVVQKKDVLPALKTLRDLGVVHIEHQETVQGEQINRIKDDTTLLKQSLDILAGFQHEVKQESCPAWPEKVEEIIRLSSEMARHKESVIKWQDMIDQWKAWGDFDPQDFHDLAEKGVYLHLAQMSPAEAKNLPPAAVVIRLQTTKSFVRCLIASKENLDLAHLSIGLPPLSVGQMSSLQDEERIKIQECEKRLKENYRHVQSLREAWNARHEQL